MPEISVIVPVYKVEHFLSRCVNSILTQSYPDFELILVDDGSPDRCGEMCDKFAGKDSRIHVIHQKNGGLSAARNAGIDWAFANSNSRWLTFIDSDDWVAENYLHSLLSAAEETESPMSACGFYRTAGETQEQETGKPFQCLTADDYYCGEHGEGDVPSIACAKLYHKSLFQSLRFPMEKLHEDEFTTYRAVYKAGKVGVTTAKLYAYYQNPAGIMQTAWSPKKLDALEAFEQQIAFAQEGGHHRLLEKATQLYIFSAHEQLEQVAQLPENDRRQNTKRLRGKLRNALRQGRSCGHFPLTVKNLWIYEEAYRIEPLWQTARAVKKLLGGKIDGDKEGNTDERRDFGHSTGL